MERDLTKRKGKYRATKKAYREKNKKKISLYFQKWWAENKERMIDGRREANLEYRTLFPEKVIIHNQTSAAIMKREIVRAEFCSKCGEPGDIHAHHFNYDHWENFIWLCASCHRREHVSK